MSTLVTQRSGSLDDRLARGTTASTRLRWLCLTLGTAPILLATIIDIGSTAFGTSYQRSILTPWVKAAAPMRPLVDYVDPDGWGDVRKTARLPYYDSWLDSLPSSARRLTTDERGLPNHPAGVSGLNMHDMDVIVTGASFTTLADDIDHHMAAELAKASGRPVYNASWTGYGPSLGMLWLLEDAQRLRPSQTVVWAIVQRQLQPTRFRDVWRRINANGDWTPPSTAENIISMASRIRYWPRQLEMRSTANSVIRKIAKHLAFALPVALDRGGTSSVQMARLIAPRRATMLFFEDEIVVGYHDYESANGEKLVDAIRRVALALDQREVHLLVALIPDKFTFYAHDIEPLLFPRTSQTQEPELPKIPLLKELARELNKLSVDTVDLTTILRAHQESDLDADLLYRRDDSHWSDRAIAISARHLAKVLEVQPDSAQKTQGD